MGTVAVDIQFQVEAGNAVEGDVTYALDVRVADGKRNGDLLPVERPELGDTSGRIGFR